MRRITEFVQRDRLVRATGVLLLGLVAAVVVLISAPQLVGAEGSNVVLSSSMEPTLQPGDVVIVQSVPAENIESGDIITYRQSSANQRSTTHRVTDVVHEDGEVYFKTKGDANENTDIRLVPGQTVIGKVVFHIPWIGHALLFLQSDLGLLLFVILPGILLVLSGVWEVIGPVYRRQVKNNPAEGTETSADPESRDPQHSE